jgi:hypothetical protein
MKLYLFFILIFSTTLSYGQNLSGSYRYISADRSGSRTIVFSKQNFKETFASDLTTKVGIGSYSIKNGQLVLKYEEVADKDTSKYEIQFSDKSRRSATIELKVLDSNGVPMVANYGCRDKNNNPLNLVFTNDKGIGNMLIFNDSLIGYFTIDAMGYNRIYLPIKRLMGRNVSITAYLRPETTTYVEPQSVKYKILEMSNDKLVLKDGMDRLVFEKID